MKRWTRLLTVLLCLSLLLSAVPAVMAQADEFEYGPALESPLSEEEKQELLASLYEADIISAREAIREGMISCQELTAYYLQRIEDYADPYNCFITVCDNAMEVARERDAALVAGTAEGALFGIPIVVKDNIKYAGYPTTNGDKGLLRTKSTSNATVVKRLLDAGAVILGKTNMCYYAYAAGHSTSTAGGTTKNAYSTYLSPGGSSGGSAVAVSLNFALAALGTDTGSSLRLPAVLNGCYSMRVTHGSISRTGITTLSAYKDVVGSINRTVEDLALMLDVMSTDTNFYENLDGNALNGAKFAVIKELSGPTNLSTNNSPRTEKNVDDEVEAAFWNAVEELRACGAEVIEISWRSVFSTSYSGKKTNFNNLMKEYDLDGMIFPTYLHTPQRIGKDENGKSWTGSNQAFINNCHHISPPTGVPEIAIPIGNHSNGASIGMEIASYRGNDQQLLNYAYSYSLRYDHRVTPEGAPNDYAESRTEALNVLVNDYQESISPTWEYAQNETGLTVTACHDAESALIRVPAEVEGQKVTGIGAKAFADCKNAETILISESITSVDSDAFAGCGSLKKIGFAGDQAAWDALAVTVSAQVVCGFEVVGDYTGDLAVDKTDAVYLLRNSLFGEDFPLTAEVDFDGDSQVSYADALRVYWHSQNPENIVLAEAVIPQQ